jgi:glycosyltransferase involved in cell wall biosynthesis
MNDVVLSIAIPTYNRAKWLQLCLAQLLPQVAAAGNSVEVTIYDNASPDNTSQVIQSFVEQGFPLSYLCNTENIGSDRNIAQCFNLAKGRYVLILGDDDAFLDGTLQKIMTLLGDGDFGAVFLSAYGYDSDFLKEQPIQFFPDKKVYRDANEFIKKCFISATFISSLIINKSSCRDLDANKFVGTSLVQTYLFYEAVLSCPLNVYESEYLLAAKRIERKDYDVIGIFCGQYNRVLQAFIGRGLLPVTIDGINRKLLWHFLPFHLLLLRATDIPKIRAIETYTELYDRYHSEFLFWVCCMPILKLPTSLARLWGYGLIILGRLVNGEFGRLWVAMREKLSRESKV